MGLKLKAEPTFKANVKIPVAGGESEPVEFVFRHRARRELEDWNKWVDTKPPNADVVMSCIEGWSLSDAFTRENVETLIDNYHGSTGAIVNGYLTNLLSVRLGN